MERNATNNHSFPLDDKRITESGFVCLLATIATVGNVMLIVTIATTQSLHTVSNLVIVNLATTDLIMATFVLPMWVVTTVLETIVPEKLCTGVAMVTLMLFLESLTTMSVISVDRYIWICNPLKYSIWVNERRMCVVIACTWLQSILFASAPLFGYGNYTFRPAEMAICWLDFLYSANFTVLILCLTILPSYTVIVVCYARIFYVARQQATTRRWPSPAARSTVNSNFQTPTVKNKLVYKASIRLRSSIRQLRGYKTVFVIVFCFLLCWTPYIGLLTYSVLASYRPNYALDFVVTYLAFASSIANPLIFFTISRDFRQTLLRTCFRRKPPTVQPLQEMIAAVAMTTTTASTATGVVT